MRRKLHITGRGRDDWIRVADANGKVVCTLPRTEERLARFIVRAVNLFGFGLRAYDKHDWWMERNEWRSRYGVQGGWQPPGGGEKPKAPTTGSGVQRA